MATETLRKIVKINEEKCNGCGVCITACAEGALKIIDGKARLISEKYCDGLGNCLKCPQDAITIETREAESYDEAAVAAHLKQPAAGEKLACGCPGSAVREFEKAKKTPAAAAVSTPNPEPSRLRHWPVQLALIPPAAPFLKNADLVLAAHCAAFTDAGFHRDFLEDNTALAIACPKLDNYEVHQAKLTAILKQSGLKSLTVIHMEVPCCSGLVQMAKQAILASGNVVPFREITLSIRGERK